jgi:hypothetical protein
MLGARKKRAHFLLQLSSLLREVSIPLQSSLNMSQGWILLSSSVLRLATIPAAQNYQRIMK